jgi:hypothetical protein
VVVADEPSGSANAEAGHPAIALAVTVSGVLVIVASALRWAYWSPASGQNGSRLTAGAGSSQLELAALGLLVAVLGFQVLSRSSPWHFAGLFAATLTTAIVAGVVASDRIAAVNRAANASIRSFCASGCGSPDVHAGAGLLLGASVAVVGFVCSAIGLVLAIERYADVRAELAVRSAS